MPKHKQGLPRQKPTPPANGHAVQQRLSTAQVNNIPLIRALKERSESLDALNELEKRAHNIDVILALMLAAWAGAKQVSQTMQVQMLRTNFSTPGIEVTGQKLTHYIEELRKFLNQYGNLAAQCLDKGDGTHPDLIDYYAPRIDFYMELRDGLYDFEDQKNSRTDTLYTALEKLNVTGLSQYAASHPLPIGRPSSPTTTLLRELRDQFAPTLLKGVKMANAVKDELKRRVNDPDRRTNNPEAAPVEAEALKIAESYPDIHNLARYLKNL